MGQLSISFRCILLADDNYCLELRVGEDAFLSVKDTALPKPLSPDQQ